MRNDSVVLQMGIGDWIKLLLYFYKISEYHTIINLYRWPGPYLPVNKPSITIYVYRRGAWTTWSPHAEVYFNCNLAFATVSLFILSYLQLCRLVLEYY